MINPAKSAMLFLGMLLSLSAARGEATLWGDSYDLAQSRAAKSGKHLMVCFTFTESNAVCRQFKAEVLDQADLAQQLGENFELVWIDVTEEVVKEPEKSDEASVSWQMRRQFEVDSFPTVVLANARGIPFAYTGYRPGGTRSYTDHIAKLLQRHDAELRLGKAAARAKGVERARLLGRTIPDLGGQRPAKFYGDIMREIIELDPKDETGLVTELKLQLADLGYVRKMQELDREVRWSDMVKLTNDYIRDFELTGSRRQAALMNRFDIHRRQTDLRGMLTTLAQVVEINQYNHHGRQAQEILQAMTDELRMQQVLQEAAQLNESNPTSDQ